MTGSEHTDCLVLGIGNVLMGDEGIGVHVVRQVMDCKLPPGVECLDGGTGGLHLLGPMQAADHIVLVDATVDGNVPGSVCRLKPRYSSDYPRALTAHDIGLKDVVDALHLWRARPDVTLFAVSIEPPTGLSTELSPELEARVPEIARLVVKEVTASSARV